MRVHVLRLAALVAAVTGVMSCDGGPLASKFGNGIAGGASGTAPVVPPAPGSVDSTLPFVRIDTPLATPQALINVGDSILVVTRVIDDRKVAGLTLRGVKYSGTAALGTLQEIERYPAISAPTAAFPFRAGLQDTVIRRYLKAATPIDTTVDSLVIFAIAVDSSGNRDSTRRVVQLVTGPKLTITAPVNGDSVPRGMAMSISVRGEHATGLDTMWIRIRSDGTNWGAAAFDSTRGVPSFPVNTRDTTVTINFVVPSAAPPRGRMIIEANAVDVNLNPGSATPVAVFARAAANVPPRVAQTVPLKLEHTDSVSVTVTADGIARIGRIILDSALAVIDSLDTTFTPPFTANRTQVLPLNLSLNDQGRRVSIISFATDSSGVTGWSVPAGTSIPITTRANAHRDTTRITYGRTYSLPRAGVAGDLAVDEVRGNVFVSNTNFNLLEVWSNTSKGFTASGVQVGSQPWGLFVAGIANRDTLLVGNSGGTTISKVNMAATPPAEILAARIRTRNTVNFEVLFTIDATSGKVVITWDGVINSYSDRPQYVAQSAGGRIFYSTRPTSAKTPGTLRWLDPAFPFPDARQIHSYGRGSTTEQERYVLFNVDSIAVKKGAAGTAVSDTIIVCDHPYGQLGGDFCVRAGHLDSAVAFVAAAGGDLEAVLGLTLTSLSLTDTNFVASSGDRNWIAFGEGNAARISGTLDDQGTPTARLMMVNDAGGLQPGFFSHAIQVDDIQENAAEKVFGLALDTLGLQIITHGDKTFVASVDLPFHLRLDGVYDSFSDGAGVAFHPNAQATNTADPCHRVGFTATRSGIVEAFDVAHYNNRGRYLTKGNLYGPLRVTRPLAGDPAGVILKLYGLTDAGLIVIDLQGKDITHPTVGLSC